MKRLILPLFLFLFLFAGCADEPSEVKPSAESETAVETAKAEVPPFNAQEFDKLLEDIPEVTRMTNPALNPNMNGGKQPTPQEVADKVLEAAKSLGWDQDRFMYVYSQSMAVMNLDQLSRMQAHLGEQMEGMTEEQKATVRQMMGGNMEDRMTELQQMVDAQVPASEQKIVNARLPELYRALGIEQ